MSARLAKTQPLSELWSDDGHWILYTEDSNAIRAIRGWNAFKDGRVRVHSEYYRNTKGGAVCFAMQFRFRRSMLRRVCKTAEIEPPKFKPLSAKEKTRRRKAMEAINARAV